MEKSMANEDIRPEQSQTSQTAPDAKSANVVEDIKPAKRKGEIGKLLSRINPDESSLINIDSKSTGTPIFDMESLKKTGSPLTQIFRMLFIKENITDERFKEIYIETANRSGMDTNTRNYSRNNLRRAVTLPSVTWETIDKWFSFAGIDLVELSLSYKTRDGRVETISLSEIENMLSAQPYSQDLPMIRDNGVYDEILRKQHNDEQS